MIGATTRRVIVTAMTAWLLPAIASAQPGQTWDPERYLEVVQEGDQLCEEALSTPEEDTDEYQERMFQCLRAKEAGLEMLRRAVLQNQVGQIEELWEDANRDLFNLTENVIVLYILLDQCIAAETILSRALREPELLPPGGVTHLETLVPEITACNDRISEQGPAFDEDRYARSLQLAESWRAQAQDRPEEDVEARSAALYEASQNYGEALGLLRDALMDGVVQSESYQEELFLLYDELINVLLEMDLCAGAQRRIRQATADAETLAVGDPTAFEQRQAEVRDCQQRLIQASMPRTVEPQGPQEPDVPELRERAEVGVAPYVLWGVAGAAAITALVLDITAAGDRDDLDAIRDECDVGLCDYDQAVTLADDLNTRKIAIGVLAGVSIVTATVGTILYFTNRGASDDAPPAPPEDQAASVEAGVPYFDWGGLGGSVRIHF